MPGSAWRAARFGPFEAEAASFALFKRGTRVKVQELPLRILFLLLQNPQRVVTRAELREALWSSDTYVDFERGLNVAMSKLREALDDSAALPTYIETLPKRGYRFVCEIQYLGPQTDPEADQGRARLVVIPPARPAVHGSAAAAPEPAEKTARVPDLILLPGERRQKPSRAWWIGAAGLALLAMALAWLNSRVRPSPPTALAVEPLTSYANDEYMGSFSPDGSQVVFSWNRSGLESKLYIKQTAGGPPRQLTFSPGRDEFAAWSPDGLNVAFMRALKDILIISPQGGAERKVAETEAYHLAWTPDSREIVIPVLRPGQGYVDLYAVSITTGARRRLTRAGELVDVDWYKSFAISPDGLQLGFLGRLAASDRRELFVRRLDSSGPARQITALNGDFFGWTWTPDSREIIFSSNQTGFPSLWRVPVNSPGEKPRAILLPGEEIQYPFMAPLRPDFSAPTVLGYEACRRNMNLHEWAVGTQRAATLLAPSSHEDISPQYAPDGRRVAFVSDRTGFPEIWLASSGSDEALALTSFASPSRRVATPRWSPDGQSLAFAVRQDRESDIFTLALNGSILRRRTHWQSRQNHPSWSHDGKWIYLASDRTGRSQIYRIASDAPPAALPQAPPAGAEAITRDGGCEAFDSPDGAYLYFTRDTDGADLWRMPLVNGRPDETHATVVIRDLITQGWWGLAGKKIFFADLRLGKFVMHPEPALKPVYSFDPATRRMERLGAIDRRVRFFEPDFAVSPDGSRILVSQIDVENIDLMMVRNFR